MKRLISKLEPYRDLIVAARRRKATWKEIAERIKERGINCTAQGVASWFHTRKRRGHSNNIESCERSTSSNVVSTQIESTNENVNIQRNWPAKPFPASHPKPYASPLWQHLDTIGTLRRKHETWAAIALHLESEHQLKTSFRTVQLFFKRAQAGRVPLGFDETRPMNKIIGAPKNEAGDPQMPSALNTNPDSNEDLLLAEVPLDGPFANLKRKYEQTRKSSE